MQKVYVTDYEYASLKEEEGEINKINARLIPVQSRTEDEVIANCKDADGLLNQYAPISRKVIENLPNLKAVGRYGVGVNTIDMEAATDHGICVVNVPDYCMDEVSDQAFALIIACMRKVVLLNNQVKNRGWDYKLGKPIHRLRGQKLGLLGFGRIPRSLAEKAKPFGFELLVYDPFVKEDIVKEFGGKLLTLDELLQSADVISIHVPLMKNTEHMISTKEFGMMKKTAIIVNTSRGAIIDESAMIEALQHKQICGAGLDVLETEPVGKDNPLLDMDNVIITPHISWYSEESEVELKQKAARGVAEVLQGKVPTYLVNKAVVGTLSLK
ncbi:C-terminal binding protein [Propionispira raffinosivorans]|uniref:C-terminal binding protein n=1 Tax=Propionispira raffinosivorans TaxID=86959 RepID=UPI000381CC82|nr:C-terminal binding protein [Propionispira raffinosivorans]